MDLGNERSSSEDMKRLPIELITKITNYCDKSTLKSLRLVNKHLNDLTVDSVMESCKFDRNLIKSDNRYLVKHLIVLDSLDLDSLVAILPSFNQLQSITLNPKSAQVVFEDPELDSTMALQKACPTLNQVTFDGDQVFKIVTQPAGIEFFKTKISACNDNSFCDSCDCSPNRFQPKLMLRKRRTLRVAY